MAKGKSGLTTTSQPGVIPKQKEPEEPSHPIVDDINAFGGYLSKSEKIDWLMKNHSESLTEDEAEAIINAAEYYSSMGYHNIHTGKDVKNQKLIDKMLDDPKAPVYGKNSYRGMDIDTHDTNGKDPKQYIMEVINSGVWKEKGISSFSASKNVAMGSYFGNFGASNPSNPNRIHVLLTYKGHTVGMPFKHISECTSEDEVLMSSTVAKKGWKITKWHTNKGGNEFFIDLDDL